MLAKPGPLPTGRGRAFEPKWDGYRVIIRSGNQYCVRSRREWQMTELLYEFGSLPVEGGLGAASGLRTSIKCSIPESNCGMCKSAWKKKP
jgi:hypothetical protein